MKMIALTPRGYWQSRRNRGDMLVTLLGVVWMVLHYMCISVQCGDFSNSFGYVIVVLRFFTITGKHVRQSVSRLALSVHCSDLTVLLLQCFLCSFT